MLINKIWKGEFIPKKSPSTKRDFSVHHIVQNSNHLLEDLRLMSEILIEV